MMTWARNTLGWILDTPSGALFVAACRGLRREMAEWLLRQIGPVNRETLVNGVVQAYIRADSPEDAAWFSERFGVNILPYSEAILSAVSNHPAHTGGLRLLLSEGKSVLSREALNAAWNRAIEGDYVRLTKILIVDRGYIPTKAQASKVIKISLGRGMNKAEDRPLLSAATAAAEAADMRRSDLDEKATRLIKSYFMERLNFPRERQRGSNEEELQAHLAFVARFDLADGFFTAEELTAMRPENFVEHNWKTPNEYDVVLWRYLVFDAKLWR